MTFIEIGSEFWIEKKTPQLINLQIPTWLTKYGNLTLTNSGRGAINLLLRQVKPKYKSVLLPSYICSSVINSFEYEGYEIKYYNVTKKLEPILEGVNLDGVGVFFHLGYFGFFTNEICGLLSDLRAKSILIVEDVTHTLFSEFNNYNNSDFVIGSIRKWMGIPSGGFLASTKKLEDIPLESIDTFIDTRIEGLYKKYKYMQTNNIEEKSVFLKQLLEAEYILDSALDVYKIDDLSKEIICTTNIEKIKTSRSENYLYLYNHLSLVPGLDSVFGELPSNVTPLFFPVYIKMNKEILVKELIGNRIYCPVHWPLPDQLKETVDSSILEIYKSILSIPCDQRYDLNDMKKIVDLIKTYLK